MDGFRYRSVSPKVWTMESHRAGLLGVYIDRELAKAAAEHRAHRRLTWTPSVLDLDGEMALHDDSRPITSDIYLISPRSVRRRPDQLDWADDFQAAAAFYRLLVQGLRRYVACDERCLP